MNFQDQVHPNGQKSLILTNSRDNHKVTLTVDPPLVQQPLPALTISYRESDWTPEYDLPPSKVWTLQPGLRHKPFTGTFPSLGKRILDEEVSWSKHLNFDGEFSFTKGYWEWAEDILSHFGKTLKKGAIYDAVYASLFTYDCNTNIIQAFCEAWSPLTNTLVTSQGELTISLRDLHMLGGLPLLGEAYDECIPTALELNKTHNNAHFSSKCCSHLFAAFHYLSKQEADSPHIRASQWIEFWCRKPQRYEAPPARKEARSRKSRPKATHNPSGILDSFKGWSSVSEAPFVVLGIPRILEEEVYLAAFLSCWLCVFVLPSTSSNVIRPETFKMACIMAQGHQVCLAVPALASIYHGLNLISRAISPGYIKSTFPYHYVYGWLSAYFNTHFEAPNLMSSRPKMVSFSGEGGAKFYTAVDARRRIFKGDSINWLYTSRKNDRDYIFHDDNKGNEEDLEYFLCLRPCLLTLRQGQQCIAEPYTPHRFSRQFGFYQAHAPGYLELDKRRISLDEGLRQWRQYAHSGSQSKATFPMNPVTPKKHHSSKYWAWLRQVKANLLEDHILDLITFGNPSTPKGGEDKEPVAPKKSKETKPCSGQKAKQVPHKRNLVIEDHLEKSSDEETHSDEDRHWKRAKKKPSEEVIVECYANKDAQSSNQPPSIGAEENNGGSSSSLEIAQAKTPPDMPQTLESTPQASIFQGTDYFYSIYKSFIVNFWGTIRDTLNATPIDEVSSFKESTERQIQLMKRDGIDLSALERRVVDFFKRAQDYDQLRSRTFDAVSRKTQDDMLSSAQDALTQAQEEHAQSQELLLDHQRALADSNGQQVELEIAIKDARKLIKRSKEKLTEIHDQKPKLEALIVEAQQQLDATQVAVSNAEKEVLRIQDNAVLTDDVEEKLNAAKKEMEAHKEDLMNFNLF